MREELQGLRDANNELRYVCRRLACTVRDRSAQAATSNRTIHAMMAAAHTNVVVLRTDLDELRSTIAAMRADADRATMPAMRAEVSVLRRAGPTNDRASGGLLRRASLLHCSVAAHQLNSRLLSPLPP